MVLHRERQFGLFDNLGLDNHSLDHGLLHKMLEDPAVDDVCIGLLAESDLLQEPQVVGFLGWDRQLFCVLHELEVKVGFVGVLQCLDVRTWLCFFCQLGVCLEDRRHTD